MVNITSGIIVKCRPRRFWRDRVTKTWHDETSGIFAISKIVWADDEARLPNDKLFTRVDVGPEN